MLYFDGISLSKYKNELLSNLKGNSINRVIQLNELTLNLYFGKKQLVLSAQSSSVICYVTEKNEGKISTEERGFQLSLKKYLVGAILNKIEQLGFDRVLIFEFSKLNELGELKRYKLYFEMMGKHSNIILTTQDNKIIDTLKRFSLDSSKSKKVVFNGMEYKHPSFEKKLSPLDVKREGFEDISLYEVEGIGSYTAKSIDSFERFQEILTSEIKPTIYFEAENKILLATILDISLVKYHSKLEFKTSKEMIEYYLTNTNTFTTFKILQNKLFNSIKKEIKKVKKTIFNLKKEIEEKKDFIKYKERGDILASSLYQLKKGIEQVELYDFYNENMITIELDSRLYPQENLEKIYKKYTKTKKGYEFAQKRLIELSEYLNYLKSVEEFIIKSDNVEVLKGIESELILQKILKVAKVNNKKNSKKTTAIPEAEIGNVVVKYGRNNLENDYIIRNTNRENLWFHCKDITGSHVVLKNSNSLTDKEIYEIALFCVKQSKIPVGSKVVVEYTKIKNLNKPKGAKPGFVTYKFANTISITVI